MKGFKRFTFRLIARCCVAGLVSCAAPAAKSTSGSTSDSLAPIPSQSKRRDIAQATLVPANSCKLVDSGYGPQGTVEIVEQVALAGCALGHRLLPNRDIRSVGDECDWYAMGNCYQRRSPRYRSRPVEAVYSALLRTPQCRQQSPLLPYTTDTNGRAAKRERWRLSSGGGKASRDKNHRQHPSCPVSRRWTDSLWSRWDALLAREMPAIQTPQNVNSCQARFCA